MSKSSDALGTELLGRQLGDEEVSVSSAGEGSASEVDRAPKVAGKEDVAGAVGCNAGSYLEVRVPKALAPMMRAGWVELGDEEVTTPSAGEGSTSEVDRAPKIAGKEDVTGAIGCNAVSVGK